MPWIRTPIHFSYVTFLAGISTAAAQCYFRAALRLCRITGTPPSLLLHPPDFLGREDDADMAYFPGMKMGRDDKLRFVRWALRRLSDEYDVQTMIGQVGMLPSDRSSQRKRDSVLPSAAGASTQ